MDNRYQTIRIHERHGRDSLLRGAELGDASMARETLGLKATVGLEQLIEMMVDADLAVERASGRQGR